VATVYKAHDRLRGEVVALKILSPILAQDDQFIERFRREVAVLRDMSHPHIVPILEYGQIDGYAYLVMPYMASGTLLDRMQRAPMTLREAALVTGQVALALGYAHQKGIVHRDVKPSNILLNEHGDALLSDFGLAYVHDASMSLTGSILIGTPAYMSPEQCKGDQVDHRSDQYSYGIVLFQITTGRLPFDAETPMGVVMKQITEALPSPRDANPDLPVAVEEVLVRALAKEPADRFDSIRELNDAFQQALIDGSARGAATWYSRARPKQRMPRVEARSPRTTRVFNRNRLRPAWLTAALLLGLPLAAVASGGITLEGNPPVEAGPYSNQIAAANLLATVDALLTASAPNETPTVPGDSSGTAIAAQLQSLQQTLVALTPTPVITGSVTPTATVARGTYPGRSPTPGGQGTGPGAPTPTPTPGAPGPTATSPGAPTPTSGSGPTATSMPPTSPPPTDVPPTQIPPGLCGKKGNVCTPVPTEPPPPAPTETSAPPAPTATSAPPAATEPTSGGSSSTEAAPTP
jgi:serine/threonine-protein kinase